MTNLPTGHGVPLPTGHLSAAKADTQTVPGVCEMHATSAPPKPPSPTADEMSRNGTEMHSAAPAQGPVHHSGGSAQAAQLGGKTHATFEAQGLAQLAASISARLAGRRWSKTLHRWHAGDQLTLFQRKTLAIMLARLRDKTLDWEECAKAKALPDRSHQ